MISLQSQSGFLGQNGLPLVCLFILQETHTLPSLTWWKLKPLLLPGGTNAMLPQAAGPTLLQADTSKSIHCSVSFESSTKIIPPFSSFSNCVLLISMSSVSTSGVSKHSF